MARGKQEDDFLSLDDELGALLDDDTTSESAEPEVVTTVTAIEEEYDSVPGQLAIDVYETEDRLIIKARTAGVNKSDLDVSITDGVLTISGTLNSGDDTAAIQWHVQECYWGEFSRTLVLPIPVKEDEVEAVLKDGVLTISFNKIKGKQPTKVLIQ